MVPEFDWVFGIGIEKTPSGSVVEYRSRVSTHIDTGIPVSLFSECTIPDKLSSFFFASSQNGLDVHEMLTRRNEIAPNYIICMPVLI